MRNICVYNHTVWKCLERRYERRTNDADGLSDVWHNATGEMNTLYPLFVFIKVCGTQGRICSLASMKIIGTHVFL